MRVSRVYVRTPLQEGEIASMDADASHYLCNVLRARKGDEVILFDGGGRDYAGTVVEAGRHNARVRVGSAQHVARESPLAIHLGLGVFRGERMDLAIQKAVELGVARITPLLTQHCVVRLDAGRQKGRHQHWRKVVQSACEQCGRSLIPELDEPTTLERWVVGKPGTKLLFDPDGRLGLAELAPPQAPAAVFILSGPEGGFADSERSLARDEGFLPVRLGPRILRAETAVLAALAVIQAHWGDLGRVGDLGGDGR